MFEAIIYTISREFSSSFFIVSFVLGNVLLQ